MKAKKFLALVLALVMALSCMSLTALAVTKDCPTCNATGEIACTTKGCVNGKVPCEDCGGDKKVDCDGICDRGKCVACDGTGTPSCHTCHGTGKCNTCQGTGKVPCDSSCDENGKENCSTCNGTSSIKCTTCNGTKTVELFSEDFTVTIPEITVGSTADDIKNGITLDETIADEIEVVDVRFSADMDTPLDRVGTAGEYLLAVVFQLNTDTYTSFNCGSEEIFYANTVTFNGNNSFGDGVNFIGSAYELGKHEIETDGFPCPYLFSIQMFEITENDGNSTILDLEPDDTYPDHTTIDQLYDVSVTEKRTDVTKVLVSWELKNIQASVTSNKIWDTKELKWVDDTTKENGATADPVTAEFNFVNLSSVKMDAQVTFAEAEGFTTPEIGFADNDETENADGIITLGTKAYGDGEIKGTITVTVAPVAEDFAKLTENATDKKYGTYTVTIRQLPTPN